LTQTKRGNILPSLPVRIVEALTTSLRAREPDFEAAWTRALKKHTPGSDWTSDADGREDSVAPITFLKNVCKAHYNYRLSELHGDPLDYAPSTYTILVHTEEEGVWEHARTAPTPTGVTRSRA
jgi:hypothetical protein